MNNHFENKVLSINVLNKISEEDMRWNRVSSHFLKVLLIRSQLVFLALLLAFLFFKNDIIEKLPVYEDCFFYLFLTIFWLFLIIRAVVEYKRRQYVVREHDILHKKGFISIRTSVIPYVRVQQVKIVEGALSRIWSLASIQISSASANGGDVMVIAGLLKDEAEEIRKIIVQNIKERDGKTV